MSHDPWVNPRRVRLLREGEAKAGPILCWLNRDLRVQDNWAVLYARERARELGQPFGILVTPSRSRVGENGRLAAFIFDGLRESAAHLERLNVPLYVLNDASTTVATDLLSKLGVSLLVVDMSPLKPVRKMIRGVAAALAIPVHQVDAHNIVPVWAASDKQEYAAYTIRPKINRVLAEYLTEFPVLGRQQREWPSNLASPDWQAVARSLGVDTSARPILRPGTKAALTHLETFMSSRLSFYEPQRNDPNEDAQSNLSPYLNTGQLSAQRVALAAERQTQCIASQEAFLEQLIVRRELSDNFCWYNDHYDSTHSFPPWARTTLSEHQPDPRLYIYARYQWETGETHDPLWNAAQSELVVTGKMHGYMRMYWAKKLLEWSATPDDAFATGVYLNDKYALDGNDPNGFVGVAWSIGGVHDRPWMERDVYGRIRYMNANGCARKFDVPAYIRRNLQKSQEVG